MTGGVEPSAVRAMETRPSGPLQLLVAPSTLSCRVVPDRVIRRIGRARSGVGAARGHQVHSSPTTKLDPSLIPGVHRSASSRDDDVAVGGVRDADGVAVGEVDPVVSISRSVAGGAIGNEVRGGSWVRIVESTRTNLVSRANGPLTSCRKPRTLVRRPPSAPGSRWSQTISPGSTAMIGMSSSGPPAARDPVPRTSLAMDRNETKLGTVPKPGGAVGRGNQAQVLGSLRACRRKRGSCASASGGNARIALAGVIHQTSLTTFFSVGGIRVDAHGQGTTRGERDERASRTNGQGSNTSRNQ